MECSTRGSGGMPPAQKHFAKLKHFLVRFPPFSAEKIIKCRPVGGGGGGGGGALEVNNGGLKTQTVDFQLLTNSGGM